ncbi:restriction endonuclease subunit S [Rhizobium leguminosarum]|nr:restriction endonuclease subunit S [Rhizobium leguminosarum]
MHIRGKAALAINKPAEVAPSGWEWVPLSLVAQQETGHTPSRSHPEWWGGEIPWIGIRDARLHHGGKIYDTLQTTNPLGLTNSSARLLPEGTVCLSRTASVGYVTIMGRAMATSQDFATWTCYEALLPEFLMQALVAEGDGLRKFGKGTTHTTIYFPEIRALHICLPPLPEQKRIVAKVDTLHAKSARARTELARIKTLVSRYKQATLNKAFSGELTRGWRAHQRFVALTEDAILAARKAWFHSQGLAPSDPHAIYVPENMHPFAIPASWSWLRAEALTAPITKGTTPQKEKMNGQTAEIPFIKVYNLTFDGTLDFSRDPTFIDRDTHLGELRRSITKPGDVLMNIVGPPLGKVSIVPDDWTEWNINQAIAVFRPLPYLDRRYLTYWLLSESMLDWAKRDSKATAGQSNLTLELCRGLPVPTCDAREQHEIVRRIDSAFAKIDRLATEATRALELVDRLDEAILAKAFRGELVPQDENDEPASVLLERIRAERVAAPKAKRVRGNR